VITADVTLARLLDERPDLLRILEEAHEHFRKLRNPMLRRMMAPRVTIAEAARIANIPAEALLGRLRRAVDEPAPEAVGCPEPAACGSHAMAGGSDQAGPRPAVLEGLRPVHVDVRDDIRRGAEPFAKIMAAVKGLRDDEVLVLRAPFEPVPLYDVLGRRGLAHWTERHEATDWSVWFYRGDVAVSVAPAAPAPADLVIDVRGLEPPQPMVAVLERLDTLEPGQTLVVVHERRPLFLYPQLDERGFAHETEEAAPGVVYIRIRRTGRPT
jgi:uncharacterized protein (DUF2249 family)